MAKLFLKGTIDVYGMHSSYYLNYVMWQKIWSRGRSWIRKKQWLDRVIWDWEAVPCSFRNLYATLPNVLNKHRIDRNGDGHYLIQSFICSSFRFKEGVERFLFLQKWPYEYRTVRRRTNAIIKTIQSNKLCEM